NMTDFDAATNGQGPLAIGAGVTAFHIAEVGDLGELAIALPVGTGVMHVHFIGAADEIAHGGSIPVGNDWQRHAKWSDKAWRATSGCQYFVFTGKTQRRLH